MITIDWQSGVPAYDQIVQGLIRLKAIGALRANDQLPSVRSLAVSTGVNPNTVQKAYLVLESKGIIYSVAGKGSFMADSREADDAVQEMALNGIRQAAQEAMRLGLPQEDALLVLKDVYTKGGRTDD